MRRAHCVNLTRGVAGQAALPVAQLGDPQCGTVYRACRYCDQELSLSRMRVWRLLFSLLCVACGGRTAVGIPSDDGAAGQPTSSTPSSGGTNGRAPSPTWTHVEWDPPFDSTAVYLWSGSPTDAWAVMSAGAGNGGAYFREHWDGVGWTRTASELSTPGRFEDRQVWGAPSGTAFGGATRNLQRWSGATWKNWEKTPGCAALGGTSNDDLWCSTTAALWRFDGVTWSSTALGGLRGVFARTRDDVWSWGSSGAWRLVDGTWQNMLVGNVRAVSTSAVDDVWAIQDGDLLHGTGTANVWARQNPTGASISAVWSQSKTNTWIVAAGSAMRFDGMTWAPLSLPVQDEWLLVAGSSEDVWLAGTQTLLHGRAAGP